MLCAALPARAHEGTTDALLARLSNADPGLHTYKADVAFDVGLRSFPYLRKTVHGNAYFKRPARLEVVFSDLPGVASSFRNLYVGLGTPADWATKFAISSATQTVEGRILPYLVLTPLRGGRLRQVDVYVDGEAGIPTRIVWHYRDGSIDLKQAFSRVDGHDVVTGQNADIRMPWAHAFINGVISHHAINVDVDDTVFTKKKEQAY